VFGAELPAKLRQMLASGITVTINSDDPAYFGAYLNANYEYMASVASLDAEGLAELAKNSFTASFIPQAQKLDAYTEIDRVLAEWKAEVAAAEEDAGAVV
jgi:adenosine deaminase